LKAAVASTEACGAEALCGLCQKCGFRFGDAVCASETEVSVEPFIARIVTNRFSQIGHCFDTSALQIGMGYGHRQILICRFD